MTGYTFPVAPATWFIGHMSRALREMQHMIRSHELDLIIETRDARLPLTSINPAFERMLEDYSATNRVKRLVIYNKADLADTRYREPLTRALKRHKGEDVLFTDFRTTRDMKLLLSTIVERSGRELVPSEPGEPEDRIKVMIAGMPNVGKSTILNALRHVGMNKGKAASTSSEPGHTRRLSTVIKIFDDGRRPPVFVHDSPGIMVPFLGRGERGAEAALKLALTGGMKESLFEIDAVAEYLLWRLRKRIVDPADAYTRSNLLEALALDPDVDLENTMAFTEALAKRLAAYEKGGALKVDFASAFFVRSFRLGKLGPWTLDEDLLTPNRDLATESVSHLDAAVDKAVERYVKEQAAAENNADLVSKHAEKRQEKQLRARVREGKRRALIPEHLFGGGGGSKRAKKRRGARK